MEETPYAPPPVEPPTPQVIPWEDPGRPWPGALVDTVRLLVTVPRRAYERVPVGGDVLRPVLFALALGWLGLAFTAMWELTLGSAMRGMMPGAGSDHDGPRRLVYLAMIPLGPLYVAVGLLLGSAILHVSLLLVGGAKSGYVATLRVLCYAQAASIALVLPFCGSMVAGLGYLVLEAIGLSVLHRIAVGKAVLAVLIPAALCCACILATFALFGAALFGGAAGMKDLMP